MSFYFDVCMRCADSVRGDTIEQVQAQADDHLCRRREAGHNMTPLQEATWVQHQLKGMGGVPV